ncbi:MAG: polymer-forming cytoskeletal protein [Alphaproteobacteria bacterium]
MFGRKDNGSKDQNPIPPLAVSKSGKAETSYSSPAKAASEPMLARALPAVAQPARRVIDIPSRRSGYQDGTGQETRKLTVGREITLTGEISTCDILVVEGEVSATLRDGRLIEITEAGTFIGTVEIDNADIAGKFDGDLIVRNRLTVRASGLITGRVQYGELEVQAGGQISGELHAVKPPVAAQAQAPVQASGFKDAAKAASAFDEEDFLGVKDETRVRASA